MEAIAPYVKTVLQTRIAQQYFFIRYWDRGPHIRLRFKAEKHVIDQLLQPIAASTNNAMARGRRPMSDFLKPEVAFALRSKQMDLVRSEAHQFAHDSIKQLFPVLEEFATQVSSHFEIEIRNRELRLQRRRNSQPDGVPIELWQGQISALERSLKMARLNGTEAISFIQEFGAGRLKLPQQDPVFILVSLVSDL